MAPPPSSSLLLRFLPLLLLVVVMEPAHSAAFVQPSSPSAASSWKHRERATALTTMAAAVGGEGGSKTTRRAALEQAAGLALLSGAVLGGGRAVAVAAEGAVAPQVTDRVFFDVAIGGESVGRLTFALFGKEAPQITGNFLKILDGKAQGASYDYSSVFRVQKETCIDLGRVTGGGGKRLQRNINESGYMRLSAANAADWTSNTEVNDLRHTEPFLLSMKRGGGTYEFSITLNPSSALDRDHVVFGRLDPAAQAENEAVVQRILAVPVSTDDPIQSKTLFSSAGKGFDPRAKIIYLYKPLQKIQVRGTGRL